MKDFSNEAYYLFFSTLANRTRLAIVDILREGTKSTSEISAALNQDSEIVAANLKQLEKCAIIISESSGNQRLYRLNMEIIDPISNALEFHSSKHCPGLKECIPQDKLREYLKKEAEKETYIEHE